MQENQDNVAAVVVTYNRKELLIECIEALRSQSIPLKKIIVFNNASTDGTEKLFSGDGAFSGIETIDFVTSPSNLGGAGGFEKAFEIAQKGNYSNIWIMDDDTIPEKYALEELLKAADEVQETGYSFLASNIFGPEYEPMNVPEIEDAPTSNGYSHWYKYLDKGIVAIKEATFVSLLINCDAISKVGLPLGDYFIWGDDTEYTRRLVKLYGIAYFVGKSKVLHKRFNSQSISIDNEQNPNRIKMYKNYFRNALLNSSVFDSKPKFLARMIWYFVKSIIELFKFNQLSYQKFLAIQTALFTYWFKSANVKRKLKEIYG
ncbi:Galactofuranosyltransferase GlfT1 [Streptococcus infantarius subsp. infantarius]|nr:Galactofuranosyltransferase GlfT1 [Streptococcus infantarius subsp. infantarius]